MDNRGLLPNPKETYDLNLSAVTLHNCSFETPTAILCTKNCMNPWFASIPALKMLRVEFTKIATWQTKKKQL